MFYTPSGVLPSFRRCVGLANTRNLRSFLHPSPRVSARSLSSPSEKSTRQLTLKEQQSALDAVSAEKLRRREKLSALAKRRVDEQKYGGSRSSFFFFGAIGVTALGLTVSSFLWYTGLFPSRKKLASLFMTSDDRGSISVQNGIVRFRCAVCDEPINLKSEKVVVSHGRAFHVEHFRCNVCDAELHPNNVIVSDGRLYCEGHFSLLAGRSKNCAECGKVTSRRGVYTQSGEVFCNQHRRLSEPTAIDRVDDPEQAMLLFERLRDRLDEMVLIGGVQSSRQVSISLFHGRQAQGTVTEPDRVGFTTVRPGGVVNVSVQSGLSSAEFLHTAAHEAVHAHLSIMRPSFKAKGNPDPAEEGLCELLSYLLLASTDPRHFFPEGNGTPSEKDIVRALFHFETNRAEPYHSGLRGMFALLCEEGGDLDKVVDRVLRSS